MIARDNHTREQLNHAARDRLKREGTLFPQGTTVVRHEYSPGDRVIARRNDRHLDVDNGTVGTVIDIDARTHRMRLETDLGELRELDFAYVARHVEHAYALTGHGAQGGTVTWAAVIGRPEEFTREWAYTALSRAREQTTLHVICERSEHQNEREDYAPAQTQRDATEALRALQRAMTRTESEPLALEQTRRLEEAELRLAAAQVAHRSALERPAELDLQRGLPRPSSVPFSAPPSRWPGRPDPHRGIHLGR